jgi:hypothetical protein
MLHLVVESCYLFDEEIHKSPIMQIIEFAYNALAFHTLDEKPFPVRLAIDNAFMNMMDRKECRLARKNC